MKIQIDLRQPRWLARSPRWAKLLVVSSLALVAVAVPVAWASDRFTDVPTTNPHHNDINTIAAAGITLGCNPPTNDRYCPEDPVTRQQMGSFLARALRFSPRGRFVMDDGLIERPVTTTGGTFTVDSNLTGNDVITMPFDLGTSGHVLVSMGAGHAVTGTVAGCFAQVETVDANTIRIEVTRHDGTACEEEYTVVIY